MSRSQLWRGAATYIRELIISGQSPPGTMLRLGPLAEQIGVSIPSVREALLLLAQEGWVRDAQAPIVAVLREHDAARSSVPMSDHIAQAGELLLAHLDAVSFWTDESADPALPAPEP